MRSTLAAVLLMTMLAVQCSPGTQSSNSSDPVFILHINQPVDPAFVTISYQVKGEKSGGGYANLGRSGPYLDMTATQDIPISLTLPQKDHRATALKAVVFCRGYRLAFVNVPSLTKVPSKRVAVDLVPLGSVALNGRVTLPRDENPADLRLDVYYNDYEIVFGYFQSLGGISGSGMKVSTTPLAADGSFTTTVPDFANDPVASKDPGRLKFGIRALRPYHGASERSAGARIAGQPEFGPFSGIPIALSYPDPIALELHWPE
jgi:hypothetical protein